MRKKRRKMLKWLRRVLESPAEAEPPADDHALALEREAQGLRLDLKEREQLVANLMRELERQRNGESARITEAVQSRFEKMMADVAAPAAQLLTQAHLLEVEGKPVQAKDVLAVAKRLMRSLEDEGLKLEGGVGETASFDPNRHEPLSGQGALTRGQAVVVRFAGVSYRGRLIRKAGVDDARKIGA
jgi:molecular chaperone GrpE (heat shock protein)